MRIYLGAWLAAALLAIAACTSKESEQLSVYQEFQDDGTGDEIQRMKDYRYRDTVSWRGSRYVYEVVRRADDSLALVTDEDGRRYADNYIELTVSEGGRTLFSRRFTKQTFAAFLDAGFKKNAILEGMAFDSAQPDGLRFSASVSYPLSDMYMPFALTVSASGGLHIARDEVLDNVAEPTDTLP